MFICDWDDQNGWHNPQIVPYAPLQIDPSNSTLHYALEVFEGAKAHPTDDFKVVQMFRPMMNMHRFNRSMKYLFLPECDPKEHLECIRQLVDLDRDWMP